MAIAHLGDHVHAVVLVGDLHGHREVLRGLRREVDVALLLAEGSCALGPRAGRYLDELKPRAGGRLGGVGEERGWRRRALDGELREGRRVALDGLRDILLLGVELHRADDAVGARLRLDACGVRGGRGGARAGEQGALFGRRR